MDDKAGIGPPLKRQSFSKCWLWLALSLAGTAAITRGAEPLKLHSANPHYFLFRGHANHRPFRRRADH
jgi:hypothetical protein